MPQTNLYDTDFCEWTAATAKLLREGRFDEVDIAHVAEEIEDMGKSDYRKLESCLTRIMEHLLKLRLTKGHLLDRNRGQWNASITRQRVQIERLLKESPSLRPKAPSMIPDAYRDAVRIVEAARLVTEPIPPECPFTETEVLADLPPDQAGQ